MKRDPLLITPPPDLGAVIDPRDTIMRIVPAGLLFIAEALRAAGASPLILRMEVLAASRLLGSVRAPAREEWKRWLREILAATGARTVGVQCHWSFYGLGALETAALVKEIDPGITTVLGGAHASALASEIIEGFPAVDAVVAGEGEEPMRLIVERAARGLPPTGIGGAFARDAAGRAVKPPGADLVLPRERIPLVTFDPDLVHPAGAVVYAGLPLVRGICPMRCTFCTLNNAGIYGRGSEFIDTGLPGQLEIMDRLGIPVYLPENIFTEEPLVAIRDIVTARRLRRLRVFLDIHPAMLREGPVEILAAIHRASAGVRLWVGIESGDEAVRRRLGRYISDARIREALGHCRRAGLTDLMVSFMTGLPGEDDRALAATEAMLLELAGAGVTADVYPCVAFPGTRLYEAPEAHGIRLRWSGVRGFFRLSQGWFAPLSEDLVSFETPDFDAARVVRETLRLRILARRARGLGIPSSLLFFMMHPRRPVEPAERARILATLRPYIDPDGMAACAAGAERGD